MHMPRIASALVALTLVACTDPGPLRLAVSVDRNSLVAQDSVKLSLELVNQSLRTIKTPAPESYGLCMHAFQVVDAQDREVGVASGFCFLLDLVAQPLIDLLPGQSITITDYWHPGSSTLDGHVIGPGEYRLIGRVFGDGETITSGPTTVTLLP